MKKIIVICMVSMLSMSHVVYGSQEKPEKHEDSLHLFYKNQLFHKSFLKDFGKSFLIGFLGALGGGLSAYGAGGDFNTGYGVGAYTTLSNEAYRTGVLPSNQGHRHAFGRCFVDEASFYVVDVLSCENAFIKAQYIKQSSHDDLLTKQMKGPSSSKPLEQIFVKTVEYDKCRDWALELHKRKLRYCEDFTSPEQMPYLNAVINRIKDEQRNPRKYWEKSDTYEVLRPN